MSIFKSKKSLIELIPNLSYHINQIKKTRLSIKQIIPFICVCSLSIFSFTGCATTSDNIFNKISFSKKATTNTPVTEEKKPEQATKNIEVTEKKKVEPKKEVVKKAAPEPKKIVVKKEAAKKAPPEPKKVIVKKEVAKKAPPEPKKEIAKISPTPKETKKTSNNQKNILDIHSNQFHGDYKGEGKLFYGDLHSTRKWRNRFFDNTTSGDGEDGLPAPGDILVVIGDKPVKIREFWAPTPAIGVANPGDKVKVLEVDELGLRKIWIKFTSDIN